MRRGGLASATGLPATLSSLRTGRTDRTRSCSSERILLCASNSVQRQDGPSRPLRLDSVLCVRLAYCNAQHAASPSASCSGSQYPASAANPFR